jgi:hypothetical protein
MIQVAYPPRKVKSHKVGIFLAGSIEMNKASNWQEEAIRLCNEIIPEEEHDDYIILNPRRKDWNSEWKQDINDANFYNQVNWELQNLNDAEYILFYLEPGTVSPISLMELGRFYDNSPIVVCPEGFERKGNVDIFCEREGIEQRSTLREAIEYIIE